MSSRLNLNENFRNVGGIDLVLIGADDPAAMTKHTVACKTLGIPFVADPSQQLPRLDGQQTIDVVDGAKSCLTTNRSNFDRTATGWSTDKCLNMLLRVTTMATGRSNNFARWSRHLRPVAQEKSIMTPGVSMPSARFLTGGWGLSPQDVKLVRCCYLCHRNNWHSGYILDQNSLRLEAAWD
jgi:hypothetical protein